MLSAILQKATARQRRLADPVFSNRSGSPYWETSPDGVNLSQGLFMYTEDIAKFGQFVLDQASGAQTALPKEWFEQATQKQVSNGDDPENDWCQGYGFQFGDAVITFTAVTECIASSA